MKFTSNCTREKIGLVKASSECRLNRFKNRFVNRFRNQNASNKLWYLKFLKIRIITYRNRHTDPVQGVISEFDTRNCLSPKRTAGEHWRSAAANQREAKANMALSGIFRKRERDSERLSI